MVGTVGLKWYYAGESNSNLSGLKDGKLTRKLCKGFLRCLCVASLHGQFLMTATSAASSQTFIVASRSIIVASHVSCTHNLSLCSSKWYVPGGGHTTLQTVDSASRRCLAVTAVRLQPRMHRCLLGLLPCCALIKLSCWWRGKEWITTEAYRK